MAERDTFHWRSCGLTTVGTVRKHNEDSYLALPEHNLWVVADGMGGHLRGDVASQAVVQAYNNFAPGRTLSPDESDREERAINVNSKIRENIGDHPSYVMGSTVGMMYAKKQSAFFLWAGHSRIYRNGQRKLEQIPHDHSFMQES